MQVRKETGFLWKIADSQLEIEEETRFLTSMQVIAVWVGRSEMTIKQVDRQPLH
jgi:hypothetical protein